MKGTHLSEMQSRKFIISEENALKIIISFSESELLDYGIWKPQISMRQVLITNWQMSRCSLQYTVVIVLFYNINSYFTADDDRVKGLSCNHNVPSFLHLLFH